MPSTSQNPRTIALFVAGYFVLTLLLSTILVWTNGPISLMITLVVPVSWAAIFYKRAIYWSMLVFGCLIAASVIILTSLKVIPSLIILAIIFITLGFLTDLTHHLMKSASHTSRALAISRSNLQAILNNSLQGFILIDQGQFIREFNKKAYEEVLEMTQLKLEKGQSVIGIVPIGKFEGFKQYFARALKGETTVVERPIQGKDGSENWFEFNFAPVWRDSGEIGGVCLGLVNINSRRKAQENVERSEARFRSMVQNSQDIIAILDEDEIIRYSSPTIERLLGYNPETVTGKPFSKYLHPDDLKTYRETLDRVKSSSGTVAMVEVRVKDDSGAWTYMEIVLDNRLTDQAVNGLILNIRDNSQHRQFMEAFRQQNEYMAVMHETALSLLNRLDITELLQTIIGRAATLGGTPDGFIYLREPESEFMVMTVGVGFFANPAPDPVRLGEYFGGQVWSTGQPLVVSDYKRWPGRISTGQYDTIKAAVGVPLKSGLEVVGVIGLASQDENRQFGQEEIELLNRISQLASIALDNARLYSAARRRLVELTTVQQVAQVINSSVRLEEIFQTIVSQISQAFGYKLVSIYLRNGNNLVLQAVVGYDSLLESIPVDSGISGRVVRTGTGYFVRNAAEDKDFLWAITGITQAIIIPLKGRDGQVVGVLAVESQGDPLLSEEDFNLLTLLSDQVSVAIRNAHLFENLSQSEEKYREVVSSVKEIIFQTDKTGVWTFLNSAWTDLLGYSVEETLGKPLLPYVYEEDWERGIQKFRALTRGEIDDYRLEVRLIARDGSQRWMELVARRALGDDGEVVGISGTLDDITERKKIEFLEQDRNEILEMVARNHPLPIVLEKIALTIERQRPDVYCSIHLLESNRIYKGAAPSLPKSYSDALEGVEIGPDVGSCGTAAYRREPVIVHDIKRSPYWVKYRDLALGHGLQACWSMPIISSKREILGTVALYWREPTVENAAGLELLSTITRLAAIGIEQRHLNDQLNYQAHFDSLTGLPNRMLFEDRLDHSLAVAQRNRQKLAVLFVDLDRFKVINDTLGHHTGDMVLQEVAQRLQGCIRHSDTVARLGGDEFTLILTELKGLFNAERVAQKLMAALEPPIQLPDQSLHITPSIGISLYPDDGETAQELLSNADRAMYRAKLQGKNNYQFFSPEMNTQTLERLELENQLRRVLERNELRLLYQPQVDLKTGKMIGYEALLRWKHPVMGQIPPSLFIPLAEESGMIVPIGAWVLEQACRQAKTWQDLGYPAYKVAVNVSALQFNRADFIPTVQKALEISGLAPKWLELELTESLLFHDTRDSLQKLSALKEFGVKLSLDDFGTGYSSLSYLQQLPIDTLKIDQSFIGANPQKGPRGGAIISAIVTMAHSLGMRVVAEGVETQEQLNFLHQIDCDAIQGYIFSPPVIVDELENLLKQTTSASSLLQV
ncbi:MAG: EAL domain-containing protein [Chloroflexi bacterium]|nr:EAL domain-containing protein [Chloroflexota bacterium]